MAEERKISPGVAVVAGGLALGVVATLVYALTAWAAPPPGLANVTVTVTDVDGQPMGEVLLGLNSLQRSTDYNGSCQFTDLEARQYSGSCFKEGYRLASVILNGVGISFDPSGYF